MAFVAGVAQDGEMFSFLSGWMGASGTRNRFIVLATVSYLLFALAWIFLSDRLLGIFADVESIVWLSTAKGVFFVVATAAMFFFSLRSVPPARFDPQGSVLGSLASGFSPGVRPGWLIYGFGVVVTLAMLVMSHRMASGSVGQSMQILFVFPVILSALLGGLGPGLLSTGVAVSGLIWMSTGAGAGHHAFSDQDLIQLVFLIGNGLAVSLLSEVLRKSVARVEINRQLLDSVVSGTSDAIFVKDAQGRYLLANDAAAAFIGKPPAKLIGLDDLALFPQSSARAIMEKDQQVMAAGRIQTHDEHLATHDGKNFVFLVTKGPIFDEAGHVTGLFGISRDITERKRADADLLEREQRLARVIEGSDQGYWDWNLMTNAFQVSARWEEMLGYARGEMDVSLERWPDHVHPADLALSMESIRLHVSGATPSHEVEMRCRTKAGDWRWIASRGRIVQWDSEGRPLMMSGTHSDITDRKVLELTQREAATVFENSYEGIMVVDPARLLTKVNPAFTRITGYSAQEVMGQSPKLLSSGRQDAVFYRDMWTSIVTHDFWRGEIWNRRKNGEVYAALLAISVVRDASGVIQHYIGSFSDISQLKDHEAELDRIAHYDPLTGSPNRRLLSDRLGQAIIRSARSGRSLAVCFLDLDGFKSINDVHGHFGGDQLLIGISENLKRVLRADDTLARLGGDEFVLLLADIASSQECTLILDRVLAAVNTPVRIGDLWVTVSASIGVSLYPDDHVDADTLLRHADQAMYFAKEAGKNRYHLFDPESDRKAQAHRKHLGRLREALLQNEFVLYYQPKVDLRSGEIVGVEALIRWQHPQKGLLSPATFLPHVNGSDLEVPLGEWVINTALAQAAVWHQLGLAVTVSANVNADHLLHPDFHTNLQAALARHPEACATHFELEVLETAAIADMAQAVDIIQQCRKLGVHFALDDFGTGYSSLTYLRKLPVNTLKIDQSFVRDMLNDPDDLGIVEGVIRLASAFNKQVIAEGVETLAHGAALLRLGCHLAQGYGIAKPMPADQFFDWSKRWEHEAAWLGLADSA